MTTIVSKLSEITVTFEPQNSHEGSEGFEPNKIWLPAQQNVGKRSQGTSTPFHPLHPCKSV